MKCTISSKNTSRRRRSKITQKAKNRVKITEGEIKKACCDYLQILKNQGKLMFLRNNTLAVQTKSGHYVKNGTKGSPDILVWMIGKDIQGNYDDDCVVVTKYLRSIAIETKSDIGIQSKDQIKWQADFEKIGGEYYIVRSLDDLIKIIL